MISSIRNGLNEHGEKQLKVNLNKKKLLNEYKKWKPIKVADLASLGETIDALSSAREYYQCILRIHQKTCAYHMTRKLLLNCAEVLNCANEFGKDRATVQFAKQEKPIDKEFWQQQTLTLNFTPWCVPECYNL